MSTSQDVIQLEVANSWEPFIKRADTPNPHLGPFIKRDRSS